MPGFNFNEMPAKYRYGARRFLRENFKGQNYDDSALFPPGRQHRIGHILLKTQKPKHYSLLRTEPVMMVSPTSASKPMDNSVKPSPTPSGQPQQTPSTAGQPQIVILTRPTHQPMSAEITHGPKPHKQIIPANSQPQQKTQNANMVSSNAGPTQLIQNYFVTQPTNKTTSSKGEGSIVKTVPAYFVAAQRALQALSPVPAIQPAVAPAIQPAAAQQKQVAQLLTKQKYDLKRAPQPEQSKVVQQVPQVSKQVPQMQKNVHTLNAQQLEQMQKLLQLQRLVEAQQVANARASHSGQATNKQVTAPRSDKPDISDPLKLSVAAPAPPPVKMPRRVNQTVNEKPPHLSDPSVPPPAPAAVGHIPKSTAVPKYKPANQADLTKARISAIMQYLPQEYRNKLKKIYHNYIFKKSQEALLAMMNNTTPQLSGTFQLNLSSQV